MLSPLFPPPSFRPALSVIAGVLTLLAGHRSAAAPAADPAAGARLLKAQLPAGAVVAATDCEPLSRAVVRAIYSDRPHATDIVTAALSAGLTGKNPVRRSCKCVVLIVRNAVIVAPHQASSLLEAAASLYPECADDLAKAIDATSDKNPVPTDGKDRAPAEDRNTASRDNSQDPASAFAGRNPGDPGDLGNRDLAGLGFGSGFDGTPGFPGSPGFVGSSPSGGFALPPVTSPVTSVVNQ